MVSVGSRLREGPSPPRRGSLGLATGLLLAAWVGAGTAPAAAQGPETVDREVPADSLREGDRVRWMTVSGSRWQVGDLFVLTREALVVRTFNDPRLEVPVDRVASLELRTVNRSGVRKWVAGGAAVGAALGIAVGFLVRGMADPFQISVAEAVFIGGGVGVVPGAFIGWVIGDSTSVRWVPVAIR